MPYIHQRDHELLREGLKRSVGSGTSPNCLIEAVFGTKDPPISRSTVVRFLQRKPTRHPDEFTRMWEVLSSHPTYKRYFPKMVEAALDVLTFASAMGQFFSDDKVADTFDKASIGTIFADNYVLYRGNWAPHHTRGHLRVSRLEILARQGGVVVTEVQDFTKQDPPFSQTDTGAMFSYGPHAYFMLKESGGSMVKLGVISKVFPSADRRMRAEWFQGWLFGAGAAGIFQGVKFFCRRYKATVRQKFGVMELEDVDDEEALACFASPPASAA